MGSIQYLPFCLFALSVMDSSVQAQQKVKLKTTANLRNQLVLRCSFSGTTDVSKITWQKDGKYLTHYGEETQVKNNLRLGEIQERLNYQELVMDRKTKNDSGVYSCMVERKDGTAKFARLSVDVTKNLTEFGIFSNGKVRSTASCSQRNIPIDSNPSGPYTCLSLGYEVNGTPHPSLSSQFLNSSMLRVECSWNLSSVSKPQRTRICLHVPVNQVTRNLTEFGIFSNGEVRSTASCSQRNIPIDSNTSGPYTCLPLGYELNSTPSPSVRFRVLNSSMLRVECSWNLSSTSKPQRASICLHVPIYQGCLQKHYTPMVVCAVLTTFFGVICGGLLIFIWHKYIKENALKNTVSKAKRRSLEEKLRLMAINVAEMNEPSHEKALMDTLKEAKEDSQEETTYLMATSVVGTNEPSDETESASCSSKENTGTDDKENVLMETDENKNEENQEASDETESASCSSTENTGTKGKENVLMETDENKNEENQEASDGKTLSNTLDGEKSDPPQETTSLKDTNEVGRKELSDEERFRNFLNQNREDLKNTLELKGFLDKLLGRGVITKDHLDTIAKHDLSVDRAATLLDILGIRATRDMIKFFATLKEAAEKDNAETGAYEVVDREMSEDLQKLVNSIRYNKELRTWEDSH